MLLIMCPTSRNGKGKRNWHYWKSRLTRAGVAYECVETCYRGHAFQLALQAKQTVVAVGGDGTINEVINGILISGNEVKMGVLYSGTSPDFCRFHNIPVNPSDSIETLLQEQCCKVDVVKTAFHTHDNSEVTRYFACSCNIGLGSDVARFSNKNRKFLGDSVGTLLGLVRAIICHKPKDLQLTIDGTQYLFEQCNHSMIIKNPHIASGIKLDIDLGINDGMGYVFSIQNKSRIGLLNLLPKIYTGKITSLKDVFLKPFSEVEVRSTKKVEIEFDGDPQGYLPMKAEMLSGKLNLIGAVNA